MRLGSLLDADCRSLDLSRRARGPRPARPPRLPPRRMAVERCTAGAGGVAFTAGDGAGSGIGISGIDSSGIGASPTPGSCTVGGAFEDKQCASAHQDAPAGCNPTARTRLARPGQGSVPRTRDTESAQGCCQDCWHHRGSRGPSRPDGRCCGTSAAIAGPWSRRQETAGRR